MNHKSFTDVEIKDADTGEVSAIISTFDVIDSDGDVTVKGAFTEGAPVRISAYNHQSWQSALPVGKGTIHEEGDHAIFKGRFFLDTTVGRDTFTTVKNLGELGEWSYSLENVKTRRAEVGGKTANILERIDVHEVSPVLKGASIGTRTLSAKGAKFSEHATSVLADVDALITRASEVMALRAQKGKSMGGDSQSLLEALTTDLDRLKELLESGGVSPTDPPGDGAEQVDDWAEALDLLAAAAAFRGVDP